MKRKMNPTVPAAVPPLVLIDRVEATRAAATLVVGSHRQCHDTQDVLGFLDTLRPFRAVGINLDGLPAGVAGLCLLRRLVLWLGTSVPVVVTVCEPAPSVRLAMILDRMGVGGVMHPDTLVNTGATLPTTSSAPLPGGQSLTFSAEEWHLLSATWKGVDIARLTRQWGIPAPTLYSRRKRVLWRLGLRQASDLHAWRHALMRRDLTVMH